MLGIGIDGYAPQSKLLGQNGAERWERTMCAHLGDKEKAPELRRTVRGCIAVGGRRRGREGGVKWRKNANQPSCASSTSGTKDFDRKAHGLCHSMLCTTLLVRAATKMRCAVAFPHRHMSRDALPGPALQLHCVHFLSVSVWRRDVIVSRRSPSPSGGGTFQCTVGEGLP